MTEILLERNRNFAKGQLLPQNLVQQRENTLHTHQPHTIVVCCSDSRVCPEFIFNCGLGEIFVIRTAGNTVDSLVLESIKFAVNIFPIQQIILMGHTNCGAIRTIYFDNQAQSKFPTISLEILPSIQTARELFNSNDEGAINFATIENLKKQLSKVSTYPTIAQKFQEGTLKIWTGIYNLEIGIFDIIGII